MSFDSNIVRISKTLREYAWKSKYGFEKQFYKSLPISIVVASIVVNVLAAFANLNDIRAVNLTDTLVLIYFIIQWILFFGLSGSVLWAYIRNKRAVAKRKREKLEELLINA
jgi:hypothetical protein